MLANSFFYNRYDVIVSDNQSSLTAAGIFNNWGMSNTVVLTAKQIEDLAAFAKEDGQPQYTITTGTIPEFEADDGEVIPEYTGLIAYSESLEHSVLQLDN